MCENKNWQTGICVVFSDDDAVFSDAVLGSEIAYRWCSNGICVVFSDDDVVLSDAVLGSEIVYRRCMNGKFFPGKILPAIWYSKSQLIHYKLYLGSSKRTFLCLKNLGVTLASTRSAGR